MSTSELAWAQIATEESYEYIQDDVLYWANQNKENIESCSTGLQTYIYKGHGPKDRAGPGPRTMAPTKGTITMDLAGRHAAKEITELATLNSTQMVQLFKHPPSVALDGNKTDTLNR